MPGKHEHVQISLDNAIAEEELKIIAQEEYNNYSITPTTIRARQYFKDHDSYFIEQYQHKNSFVQRFGLNVSSEAFIDQVKIHNESIQTIKGHKSNFSIASEKTQQKKVDLINEHREISAKLLTEFEKYNTRKAIEYLNNSATKIAIVDVLVRKNDKIEFENGIPAIHAVVLYSKGDHYLVIDPSNASFSQIIAGVDDNIRVCFNNKIQIYKPLGNTGYAPDLWRDCIDIAVKLAFNLTVNAKLDLDDIRVDEYSNNAGIINHESLKNSCSVKEITNQLEVYKILHSIVKTQSIKIKQSSDVTATKKTTALLTIMEDTLGKIETELLEKGMNHLLNHFNKLNKSLPRKIFNSSYSYDECLEKCIKTLENDLSPQFYSLISNNLELLQNEFNMIIQMTGDLNENPS